MLTISFEAKDAIARSGPDRGERPFRLLIRRDGAVDLRPDDVSRDDLTFSHEGALLLVVDAELALRLDGKELEAHPTSQGLRLALRERRPPTPSDIP